MPTFSLNKALEFNKRILKNTVSGSASGEHFSIPFGSVGILTKLIFILSLPQHKFKAGVPLSSQTMVHSFLRRISFEPEMS